MVVVQASYTFTGFEFWVIPILLGVTLTKLKGIRDTGRRSTRMTRASLVASFYTLSGRTCCMVYRHNFNPTWGPCVGFRMSGFPKP